MGKTILATFIIGFWLFLPIPFMLFGSDDYTTFDIEDELNSFENPTVLDYLGGFFALMGVYVKLLVISFPTAPFYINIFFLFLKTISGLIVWIMLRGN